jgi:hypothetical protein
MYADIQREFTKQKIRTSIVDSMSELLLKDSEVVDGTPDKTGLDAPLHHTDSLKAIPILPFQVHVYNYSIPVIKMLK